MHPLTGVLEADCSVAKCGRKCRRADSITYNYIFLSCYFFEFGFAPFESNFILRTT